jgi:hypothetical protein
MRRHGDTETWEIGFTFCLSPSPRHSPMLPQQLATPVFPLTFHLLPPALRIFLLDFGLIPQKMAV